MVPHALLIFVLVALTASAGAQTVDSYYPLNDGDSWTYERLERSPTSLAAFRGYRRVTMLSDTTISGDAYKTARVEFLQFAQAVESTAYCAVRLIGPETRIEWLSLRGTCEATESGLAFGSDMPVTQPFHVGGLSYSGPTRSASHGNAYALTAEGIGAVETSIRPTWDLMRQQKLLVATVGGTSYGEMPESTAWRAFQPLAVGDRRAYEISYTRINPTTYRTIAVMEQEHVNDILYFRVEIKMYNAMFSLTATGVQFWRHRDDLGCIVRRANDGSEMCTDPRLQTVRARSLVRDGTVNIGGQTVAARVIRDAYNNQPSQYEEVVLAEGIGDVLYRQNSGGSGGGLGSNRALLYTRIDGVEYGTSPSWAVWPASTSGECSAEGRESLAVSVPMPNPTRDRVALEVRLAAPQDVRVTIYDALGRAVVSAPAQPLSAGAHQVSVPAAGLAAGVYVVRVEAGFEAVSRRVVVQR